MIATISGKPNFPARGEGRRRAAHPQPDRQRVLERARVHPLPGQRGTVAARPVNVRVPPQLEQQVQFFREERVVVLQRQPEERE